MPRIVPGIDTLEQHLEYLTSDPEAYRPQCCPQLWGERNAPPWRL